MPIRFLLILLIVKKQPYWEGYRDSLKTSYLENAEEPNNLLRLWCSLDEANIKLAAAFVNIGGLPDKLLYPILLLSFVNPFLREVLIKNAPVALVELILKHFSNSPQKNRENVPWLMEFDSEERMKIADAFHAIFLIRPDTLEMSYAGRRHIIVWPLDFYNKFAKLCFRGNDAMSHHLLQKHLEGKVLNLRLMHNAALPSDLSRYEGVEEVWMTVEMYLILPVSLATLPNLRRVKLYHYNQRNPCTLRNMYRFQQLLPNSSLEVIDNKGCKSVVVSLQ